MGNLARNVNENPSFEIGDLTPATEARKLDPHAPVLATPAAAAAATAGAAAAVGAGVAGYIAEEAADG